MKLASTFAVASMFAFVLFVPGLNAVAAQNVVITNARIIVGPDRVIEKGTLVVKDGRIVSEAAGPAPASAQGTRIDGTGMTLISGYIDGHRHLVGGRTPDAVDRFFKQRAVDEMRELLEAGITTVQSGGDDNAGILKLRDMIDSGKMVGPRILASAGVPTWSMSGEADVRAAVDRAKQSGADSIAEVAFPHIAVCSGACPPNPDPTEAETALLKAGLDEAKKVGIPFQIHAVSPGAVMAAVRIGATRLVHTPHYGWLTDAEAQEVAKDGVRVASCTSFGTPVFDVYNHENKPTFRDGKPWPSQILQGEGRGREAGLMPVNGRTFFDNGVDYGFATDTSYFATAAVLQELKTLNLVFSPIDLIRIMGPNSADFVDRGADRGTLEVGKLGDIVMLAGNPLDGYWNYESPVVVIKGGAIVVDKRSQLHDVKGINRTPNP